MLDEILIRFRLMREPEHRPVVELVHVPHEPVPEFGDGAPGRLGDVHRLELPAIPQGPGNGVVAVTGIGRGLRVQVEPRPE